MGSFIGKGVRMFRDALLLFIGINIIVNGYTFMRSSSTKCSR